MEETWGNQILSDAGLNWSCKPWSYRFKIRNSSNCFFCRENDSLEYTIFHCSRWYVDRNDLIITVGCMPDMRNVVAVILRSKDDWLTCQPDYINNPEIGG